MWSNCLLLLIAPQGSKQPLSYFSFLISRFRRYCSGNTNNYSQPLTPVICRQLY